jgi:hypothetical protein
MFSIEPIVAIIAVRGTAIFMREMPRLFAALIVRLADQLLAARHAGWMGAFNGRHVPVTWTAAPEDRKLLRAGMRSTMRVTIFRSLYPNRR